MADKYLRIAYKIEADLRHMRADGKTKLPTEELLCQKYDCSRQTIRASLKVLEDKGLIVKKRGSGSYLADNSAKLKSTVVFITGDKFEYINPEFISQLKAALKTEKYDLVCYGTNFSFSKEKEALENVLSMSPSAVIIEPIANIVPNPNIELIEQIDAKGIPVIYLYSSYSRPENALCIREDDNKGAEKLVSHLKDKGHSKTACIFRVDDTRGLERYKGYIKALDEYGIAFDENNSFFFTVRDRTNLIKGNDEMLQRFVASLSPDCTAVICHNDEIAYRLIKLLEQKGIAVPGRLAIVSFENSYLSSGSAGITSLGHNEKELASRAADAVLAAAEHRAYKPDPVRWILYIRSSG